MSVKYQNKLSALLHEIDSLQDWVSLSFQDLQDMQEKLVSGEETVFFSRVQFAKKSHRLESQGQHVSYLPMVKQKDKFHPRIGGALVKIWTKVAETDKTGKKLLTLLKDVSLGRFIAYFCQTKLVNSWSNHLIDFMTKFLEQKVINRVLIKRLVIRRLAVDLVSRFGPQNKYLEAGLDYDIHRKKKILELVWRFITSPFMRLKYKGMKKELNDLSQLFTLTGKTLSQQTSSWEAVDMIRDFFVDTRNQKKKQEKQGKKNKTTKKRKLEKSTAEKTCEKNQEVLEEETQQSLENDCLQDDGLSSVSWTIPVSSSQAKQSFVVEVIQEKVTYPGLLLSQHHKLHSEDQGMRCKINVHETSSWTDSCLVCGLPASGCHYGITACEGCKGFFRRSILMAKEYTCKLQNTVNRNRCVVLGIEESARRKCCRSCRLKKCFKAGMRSDAVINVQSSKDSGVSTETQTSPVVTQSPVNLGTNNLPSVPKLVTLKCKYHDRLQCNFTSLSLRGLSSHYKAHRNTINNTSKEELTVRTRLQKQKLRRGTRDRKQTQPFQTTSVKH